jgi:hypothetical protein
MDPAIIQTDFLLRLAIDLACVFILFRGIYFHTYRRGDLFLSFFSVNLVIFLIAYVLNSVEMTLGAAFGLFAVFSMLRYRTEGLSPTDMTYLFLGIALGLIMAISDGGWVQLVIFGAVVIGFTWILEAGWLTRREVRQTVQYDRGELLHTSQREELLEDLRARTGLNIHRCEVREIDLLRDSARLHIYYHPDRQGQAAPRTPAGAGGVATIVVLGTMLGAVATEAQVAALPLGNPITDISAGAELWRVPRPIMTRFDADSDGRLDRAERRAAQDWLEAQPEDPIMGENSIIGRARVAALGRIVPGTPGPRMSPADVRPAGDASLYDPGTLRTLFLEFEGDDWEGELAAFNNTDVDVSATVRVDGREYRDVGVRFRGMSSYFMIPAGSKRSLGLSFDFVHNDQRLLGYRTLNLLNAFGDATMMRGVLYAEIARHYLPIGQYNFMRVVINGEYWGVYVNAQQYNSEFVREHFSRGGGVRWRVPGFPRAQGGMAYVGDDLTHYRRFYQVRTRETPAAWADLLHLFRVLTETPVEQLEAALEPLLNVDGALRFLALDMALVNMDGYWVRGSDYSIYQDRDGRFHVLPHDINEGLLPDASGDRMRTDPLIGLDDPALPLRSRLLAVPALRERYIGYVREIAEQWLDWNRLEPLVQQYAALIRDDVQRDTRKLRPTEEWESDLRDSARSIRVFADARRAYLLEVLR